MPAADGETARRKLLAVVHMAAKSLAMAEDDYRAMLTRVTGKASAGDCTRTELHRLIAELERLGYRHTHRARGRRADSPIARKARALWIGLYELGAIDDPSERALERLGKRQLGVDRLHWADQSHSGPLIEALKAMAARHGWDQRLPPRLTSAQRGRILSERLVSCLLALLPDAEVCAFQPEAMDDAALQAAAVELGARLRASKGDA